MYKWMEKKEITEDRKGSEKKLKSKKQTKNGSNTEEGSRDKEELNRENITDKKTRTNIESQ